MTNGLCTIARDTPSKGFPCEFHISVTIDHKNWFSLSSVSVQRLQIWLLCGLGIKGRFGNYKSRETKEEASGSVTIYMTPFWFQTRGFSYHQWNQSFHQWIFSETCKKKHIYMVLRQRKSQQLPLSPLDCIENLSARIF